MAAPFDNHANLASSFVATPPAPAASGTSLTVNPGEGALFPVPPFNCTVCPANTMPTQSNAEIVRVTGKVGDTFTIIRAQEGTTAKAIAAGYFFGNSITAKVITDIEVFNAPTWGNISGSISDQTDLNDTFARLASATTTTGLGSAADTMALVALNDSTLRILAVTSAYFSPLIGPGMPINNAVKTFPQQDFPLAGMGIAVDGIFVRTVGYDSSGTVIFSSGNFINTPTVVQLGYVIVKRVAGVITFLDGAVGPRNVVNAPLLAGQSGLERTFLVLSSSVQVTPNNGAMTMAKTGGVVKGPSINWHGAGDVNTLQVSALNPASFSRINPATALAVVFPPATTTVIVSDYWNGAAMVPMGAAGNASVQRWIMTNRGQLLLQAGEFQYTNLADAIDAITIAPFTNILPVGTYVEIARTAAERSTTDLGNNAQSITVAVGGGTGGGGGSAGVTSIAGTAGEITAAPAAGPVVLSLPAALVFTGKTIAGGTFNSPVLTAPALGTPVSGVLTNCTGTALGLTAGNVITNANLTGDVSSIGNATTLATVNATTGTFGAAGAIPVITVNGKGLITNVTTIPPGAAAAGSLTGTTLAANVVNASLNNITPVGGTLAVLGTLHINRVGTGTDAELLLNADNSRFKQCVGFTNSLVRWTWGVNNQTETGANAGSNFIIARWNDAGVYVQDVMAVSRASGLVIWYEHANVFRYNSIGATSTAVAEFVNESVATAGVPQWSPALRLKGDTWRTTPANRIGAHWKIEVQTPASANGTNNLVFSSDLSDVPVFAPRVTFGNDGSIAAGSASISGTVFATGQITSGAAVVVTNIAAYMVAQTAAVGNVFYGSIGSASPITLLVNNVSIAAITSAGLSVTGVITTVGDITSGAHLIANGGPISNCGIFNATADCYITINSAGGTVAAFIQAQSSGTPNVALGSITNHPVTIRVNNLQIGAFLSTGLSITTTLDAASPTVASVTLAGGLGVSKAMWAKGGLSLGFTGTDGYMQFCRNTDGAPISTFQYIHASTEVRLLNAVGPVTLYATNILIGTVSATGLAIVGNLSCTGSLSKGSGTFKIDHPLPEMEQTHHLIHSFVEGPRADLIYRGVVTLSQGSATVNLDQSVGMTPGTFVLLAENAQVWVQNDSGWSQVRGSVTGSELVITAQELVDDTVSWLVIAERHDKNIRNADWTDDQGKPILEPLKPAMAKPAA